MDKYELEEMLDDVYEMLFYALPDDDEYHDAIQRAYDLEEETLASFPWDYDHNPKDVYNRMLAAVNRIVNQ
jgi:hypothetical protein